MHRLVTRGVRSRNPAAAGGRPQAAAAADIDHGDLLRELEKEAEVLAVKAGKKAQQPPPLQKAEFRDVLRRSPPPPPPPDADGPYTLRLKDEDEGRRVSYAESVKELKGGVSFEEVTKNNQARHL